MDAGYHHAVAANLEATPDEAIAVIEEMVADYRRRVAGGRVRLKRAVDPRLFACVAGLTAHAHALAEASNPLWDSTTTQVACLPLARAAFECGLLAQWLNREPLALDALLAEYERQVRALSLDMLKVPRMVDSVQPMLDNLTGQDSPLASTARSIERIAKCFQHGDEIYAYYRLLTKYTHAGVPVVEQWVAAPRRSSRAPFALLSERQPEKEYSIFFAWGLLFTATAYGDLVRADNGYNNRLNRWADRVGVDRRLRLAGRS